jgi:hypothetical protein
MSDYTRFLHLAKQAEHPTPQNHTLEKPYAC